jgi:hypothetical protein
MCDIIQQDKVSVRMQTSTQDLLDSDFPRSASDFKRSVSWVSSVILDEYRYSVLQQVESIPAHHRDHSSPLDAM